VFSLVVYYCFLLALPDSNSILYHQSGNPPRTVIKLLHASDCQVKQHPDTDYHSRIWFAPGRMSHCGQESQAECSGLVFCLLNGVLGTWIR